MAFVPDSAIIAAHQIPAGAFRMYSYFCMRRDQETGTCFPSLKRTAADLEMKYSYASEMRTLLVKEGWIEMAGGEIIPVMGFKVSGKSETIPAKTETRDSEKVETAFGKSRNHVRENPNDVSEKVETPLYITSPINQPIEPEIDISARVENVFQDYCETVKKVGRTEKRLSLIKVRLLEGRSESQLHSVWLGALRDPWPERKLHNDIVHLLETPERIERMIELSTIDLPERSDNGTSRERGKSNGARADGKSTGQVGADTPPSGNWQAKHHIR